MERILHLTTHLKTHWKKWVTGSLALVVALSVIHELSLFFFIHQASTSVLTGVQVTNQRMQEAADDLQARHEKFVTKFNLDIEAQRREMHEKLEIMQNENEAFMKKYEAMKKDHAGIVDAQNEIMAQDRREREASRKAIFGH